MADQHHHNNNNPLDWFYSLPPLTRTWLIGVSIVNIGTTMDLLNPHNLLFDVSKIYNKLELWRCITCFLYAGGNLHEFYVLLLFYMITIQSSSYEQNPFYAGGTSPLADYVFTLLFCMITTLISYIGIEYVYHYWYYNSISNHVSVLLIYPLFTQTLVTAMTYIWSRRNPNIHVNINFIPIPIPGQYLPFVHLGMAYVIGNPIIDYIHGMFVGHIYYYFIQVVPTITGRYIISTPIILSEIVHLIYGPQNEFRPDALRHQQHQHHQQRATTRQFNDAELRHLFQREGATEAHIAAKRGQLDILERIVNEGDSAMIIAKDHNDWQPLHEAVRNGSLDVINFLLSQNNVDINARTHNGHGPSPLWIAIDTHGLNHPVTRRLQELNAINHSPE